VFCSSIVCMHGRWAHISSRFLGIMLQPQFKYNISHPNHAWTCCINALHMDFCRHIPTSFKWEPPRTAGPRTAGPEHNSLIHSLLVELLLILAEHFMLKWYSVRNLLHLSVKIASSQIEVTSCGQSWWSLCQLISKLEVLQLCYGGCAHGMRQYAH
jgi:hypothetical protein